ncbi:MAG: hypothetical protein ABIZ80_05570 [Bryobacteraceae bacterium]
MNSHLSIVANGFRVVGVVLGLPSLLAFLYFGWASVRMHLLTPAPSSASSADPGSLTDLIETAGKIFGGFFRILGAAGHLVAIIITVIAFIVLVTSVLLFFTGRGLQEHSAWARIVASLLAMWMLFVSVVAVLSMRREAAALLPLLMAAGSGYSVWVLFRKFA